MASHQYLLYHIVFSTKERRAFLQTDNLREEAWAYMAGVCKNLGGYADRIGGYYDHAHLLVHIPAKVAVAEFVGKLKANTSKHMNDAHDKLGSFAGRMVMEPSRLAARRRRLSQTTSITSFSTIQQDPFKMSS